MKLAPRIHPCLWFNGNGEEAAHFYTGIFPNSRILHTSRTSEEVSAASGVPAGSVLTVDLELDGQPFMMLNGGPQFTFNEAVSLVVLCKDQAEVDHYWEKLGAGGPPEAQQCGWLKDKFGLSWQIVPERFFELMKDKDATKTARMMVAMMGMKKMDVAGLEKAFNG